MSTQYTYYLDNIDITNYLATEFTYSLEKNIAGEDRVLLGDTTLQLYNIGGAFNYYNANSIWASANPYDSRVKIYDRYDNIIYSGKVREVSEIDPVANTVSLTVSNDIDSILNKTFIAIEQDITPAEVIHNILVYYNLDQYLDMHSYYSAKQYQESLALYVDATYYIDNTTTILAAINSLSENFGTDCFLMNGKLYIVVINKDAAHNAGYEVPYRALLSLKLSNDTDNIKNQASYELGDSSFSVIIKDYEFAQNSRDTWGEQSLSSVNLTNTGQISSYSITGLQDVLQDRIWRLKGPRDYVEFEIDTSYYAVPFDLLQVFKFSSDCNTLAGSSISDYNWQPVSVQAGENNVSVKAIRLL